MGGAAGHQRAPDRSGGGHRGGQLSDPGREAGGHRYEPWHYRYVGKAAAAAMHRTGECLEEYLRRMDALEELLPPLPEAPAAAAAPET